MFFLGDATAALDPRWFEENGYLETTQVVLIAITVLRYVVLSRLSTTPLRACFAGAAVIAFACMLRELEFDENGPLAFLDRLLKGPGRITTVVVAIPIAAWAIRDALRHPWAGPRLVFGTAWGWLGILGCLTIVAGGLFDRRVLTDDIPNRWEEILETAGFLLVMISTFIPANRAAAAIDRPLRSRRGSSGPTN